MTKTKSVSFDFFSMDTLIEVKALGKEIPKDILYKLESLPQWFNRVEKTVSRFDPESELSRLNSANGKPLKTSTLFLTLMGQALEAAKKTDGIFDPTVLNSLLQSGYNKSFGQLSQLSSQPKTTGTTSIDSSTMLLQGCQKIEVNLQNSEVKLPLGLSIDLGGIAKGWAVDESMKLFTKWANDIEICINAGGDLRIHVPEGGSSWEVAVENPFDRKLDIGFINVKACGIATSSILKRRWQSQGKIHHHLINPRSGQPAKSDLVAATVVAPMAAEAEIWTKTLCILGFKEGFALLEREADHPALGVLTTGSLIVNKQMEELLNVTNLDFAYKVYHGY